MDKQIESILTYAKRLVKAKAAGGDAFIAHRIDGEPKYYKTVGPLSELDESKIETVNFHEDDQIASRIFRKKFFYDAVMMINPPKVSIVAKTERSIHAPLDDMAQIIGAKVKVVRNDADAICKELRLADAVLISDAGAIVTGRTLHEAFTSAVALEKSAHVFVASSAIGGCKNIGTIKAMTRHHYYKRNHVKKTRVKMEVSEKSAPITEAAAVETADEFSAQREQLKDASALLLDKHLIQGAWGNLSVRIDDKRMLTTPTGMHYEFIDPADMVIVDIETLSHLGKNKPTVERKIHAKLYEARGDVFAVVHTHPIYSSVFACAHQKIPCMNDAMRKLVGGDVRVAAYHFPATKKLSRACYSAMKGRNACLMANHGLLCVGENLDQAIQTAITIESACKKRLEEVVLTVTGKETYSEDLLNEYFLKMSKYKGPSASYEEEAEDSDF